MEHRAWEARDESGRTIRIFPLSDYRGETIGERSKKAFADAKVQSPPSAIITPLYGAPNREEKP